MIICSMDSTVIPRPPALPASLLTPPLPPPASVKFKTKSPSLHSKSSTTSQGFRLQEDQGDTGSVYSIYKQKIDSMFESDSSTNTKNSVQARIEKMFTDVAEDSGIPVGTSGVHTFSVDYLGSVPLQDKVTSLCGLQDPLRELYFAYKKNSKHKKPLTGRLEISSSGLKVQYQGEKGDLEQLNSFPTIAVWSAVKFVINEKRKLTYAFLPLITDPDNIDKKTLFRELDENERKYINADAHSPLFSVVMRKIGLHKQLECHGFVCQTSEDAIVIAATLYKSLMTHMKAKERRPKNRNGVTCMSIASSTLNEKSGEITPVRPPRKKRSTTSSVMSDGDILDTSDTQPLIQTPNKQPKKSIKNRRAPKAPDDLDAILPYEEPNKIKEETNSEKVTEIKPKTFSDKISTYMSREQKQITAEIKQVMSESSNRGLRHVQKSRKPEEETVRKENSGDILTKVTIPRSGSFLNAGGLTRYKSKISRSNGQATGGSPLGFNELFNEFRLQEGLHSMDEILGVIIDPDGMSFNDLKPIYKEFLLKLSVTLTKDELYQRSKSIMRRHKKKLLRRNSSIHTKQSHHISVGSKFKRLKHIFRKNIKLRLGKSHKSSPANQSLAELKTQEAKLPESSISTSSYDTRHFTPKEEHPTKKQNYRKKPGEPNRRDRMSTSEESDFFSIRRKNKGVNAINNNNQHNRNSSSGYVSCSECSYDSDTCTCVSADKCYCSLGNKSPSKITKSPDKCECHFDNTLTFCGCDTDSCTESNKCYCQSGTKNNTILDQLRRRGHVPESQKKHKKLCKKSSNTKSTRSLEYMHNPIEAYYEKLTSKAQSLQDNRRRRLHNSDNITVEYEPSGISVGRKNASYSRIVSEVANPVKMGKESSICSNISSSYGVLSSTKTLQSTAISAGACTDALSVKKSAEIAALFADIKLSQTTDIAHLVPKNYDLNAIIAAKNAYNRLKTQTSYSIKNDIKDHHQYQKLLQNALYTTRNNPKSLYSTKNGLYTIQSQSDESGRSSVSDGKRKDREYFELEDRYGGQNKNISNSLENSLGYLP